MKLLFDENLSHKLPRLVAVSFPDSRHVRELRLKGLMDEDIWSFAKANNFTLISKDKDFYQRRALRGAGEIHLAPPRQLCP